MFGYIRINPEALPEESLTRYRAFYCGLCQALGERHGAAARMALTYDLTFLAVFLSSLYEPEESHTTGRCLPHPVKALPRIRTRVTDYAADMTIALTYHKCQDDWADDHRLPAKAFASLLKKRYEAVLDVKVKVACTALAGACRCFGRRTCSRRKASKAANERCERQYDA